MKLKKKKFYSFRYKLIVLCIALTIIPTCLMSTFQYYYSSTLVEKQTREYLQDVVEWTSIKADDFAGELEDITFSIISNSTIQEILSDLEKDAGRFEKYKKMQSLKDHLSSYALLKDYISNISIVTEEGVSYSYNKNRSTSDIKVDWEKVYEADGRTVWGITNKDQQEFVVSRKINSLKSSRSLGYVSVTVQEHTLNELLNSFKKIEGGTIYLLDSSNRIVSAEEKNLLGEIIQYSGRENELHMDSDSKGLAYYISDNISNGWKIVAAISTGYFHKNVENLRDVFYILAFISALVVAALAIKLSKSVTRPLVALSGQMKRFGQGDFKARYDISTNDEFGMVGDTFNQMVGRIQDLLNEVYEQQLLKQKAELESLQMQINPHFLYNTLETVNWMARMKGINEVGDIVSSLGNLMRFALGSDTYITLEKEVSNLRDYIKIQEYRYGDRLKAMVVIPEELLTYRIPKLLIQPILENAIVHGVEDKIGDAQVSVTGEKEDGKILIHVRDNGIGMSREIIDRIFQDDKTVEKSKGTSIGLRNVHRRLKMHYGEGYGIHIDSRMGEGTEVILTLKAELFEEVTEPASGSKKFEEVTESK
ncbi:sensor histidine kinase [uncultured Robinsoniella sp.]|uniref:cache domain-containing sensor histidine kinase n=1 Tax=uncultured Robinsoniella sp. TaxID=904190 RepID=UPI00374F2F47